MIRDDLAVRLSCPGCESFRFKLGEGDDTVCQGCGTVMIYRPGRYVVKPVSDEYTPEQEAAFQDGYQAGYDTGRVAALKEQ